MVSQAVLTGKRYGLTGSQPYLQQIGGLIALCFRFYTPSSMQFATLTKASCVGRSIVKDMEVPTSETHCQPADSVVHHKQATVHQSHSRRNQWVAAQVAPVHSASYCGDLESPSRLAVGLNRGAIPMAGHRLGRSTDHLLLTSGQRLRVLVEPHSQKTASKPAESRQFLNNKC